MSQRSDITYAVRVKCIKPKHIEEGKELFTYQNVDARFNGKRYECQKEFYWCKTPSWHYEFSENIKKAQQFQNPRRAKEIVENLNRSFNRGYTRTGCNVRYKVEIVVFKLSVSVYKEE